MAIVVAFVVGLLLLVIAALVKLTVAVATAVVAHIWELAIAAGCVALAVATFAALTRPRESPRQRIPGTLPHSL